MGCTRYVGRVGALAVALGVGMAVAIAPGLVWAHETGEGTSAVDAGPTHPDPTTAPDGQDDGGIDPGEPGGGTTTTTTTSGTQSTTVIGGGETPEVTISASTVDTSGTTTEQTPESATPIGGRWLDVIQLWERAAQLILTAARLNRIPSPMIRWVTRRLRPRRPASHPPHTITRHDHRSHAGPRGYHATSQ